ncbi:MAG TPA: YciI family protein [archaeon]|nr:YciI family protein [archaeon]
MPEYVVISNLIAKPEEAGPYREAHFNYLSKLKNEGKLQIAGRFADGKGGIYILVASSDEEAKSLAEADPYHANGLRQFVIRKWERRL